MRPQEALRNFAEGHPIVCDWCARRFTHDDGVYVFKVNAEGLIGCQDCRRTMGKAWGSGPWLFISDLLRARGVTAAGTLITALVARRHRPNPEETIQPS